MDCQHLFVIVVTSRAYLNFGIMRNGGLAILRGKSDLEDTKLIFGHLMGIAVPVVLVLCQSQLLELRQGVDILKSPMKYARSALGAHSRYVMELSLFT